MPIQLSHRTAENSGDKSRNRKRIVLLFIVLLLIIWCAIVFIVGWTSGWDRAMFDNLPPVRGQPLTLGA